MTLSVWDAPHLQEGQKINATVEVPASKSLTNRYLVLEALSTRTAKLQNILEARDTSLMKMAIQKLKNNAPEDVINVDVGLAGTVMRFVPLLALFLAKPGTTVRFDGDEGAKVRPIEPIINALEQLGVLVDRENGEYLPFSFKVPDKDQLKSEVKIDSSKSSQFISALLLCAAKFPGGLRIKNVGKKLPSQTHIDMTINCLRKCGVEVRQEVNNTGVSWLVAHQQINVPDITIEPDLSNAGPFLCSVLANKSGGEVKIPYWPKVSDQPGKRFVEILEKMGAKCSFINSENASDYSTLVVTSSGNIINSIDINLKNEGEITPTVAALCALADGESTISGIGHLRGHETDRLNALVSQIQKIGRNASADENSLYIAQKPKEGLKSATIETYHDHRMATFGAILGLGIKGIRVENVETVAKTMPGFVNIWQKMLLEFSENSK